MIAHLLVVVLVSVYVAIVVFGHVLLIPESTRNAFRGRGQRYLDALQSDHPTQSGEHKKA